MATLEKITIHENKHPSSAPDRFEIRAHWSNERHQSIALSSLEPEDVIEALRKMAFFLHREQKSGQI